MAMTVVTGGGNGIGLGIVRALRAADREVAVFDADPNASKVAESVGAMFEPVDVSDPRQLVSAFQRVTAVAGSIDGLVNSAGLSRTGPAEALPTEDWDLVINVDLSGVFYVCQSAFPHMTPGGAIVNLASIASARALPGRVAYTAAKFGVVGLTRVLAVEWARVPIRVNAIGPAWTETPVLGELFRTGVLDKDALTDKIPMGRLVQIDDVVKAAMFLLGDESTFISGQTIFVDGAYTWAG
jgi:NAD(P)-dependent dehydrogenase (short-subunit alcohol dehydrogenase family)